MGKSYIEKVIYIDEVLENAKEKLASYYVDEYGSNYRELIDYRLQNTSFIVKTQPDLLFESLKNYHVYFRNSKDFDNMILEYEDFCTVQARLQKLMSEKVNAVLKHHYKVDNPLFFSDMTLEVLKFMSSSFSRLLEGNTIDESLKKDILDGRELYYFLCHKYHCDPIVDATVVDKVIKEIENIKGSFHRELLKQSKWGQRLYNEVVSKSSRIFVGIRGAELIIYDFLSQVVFKSNDTAMCVSLENSSSQNNIVFLHTQGPMMLDFNHYFYHEMRHAVEFGGISAFNDKYSTINELRTENHALKDMDNLPTIFESMITCESLYTPLLQLSYGLFDEEEKFFDNIAIESKDEEMERIIGKTLLREYEQMLLEVLELVKTFRGEKSLMLTLGEDVYLKRSNEIRQKIKKFDTGDF